MSSIKTQISFNNMEEAREFYYHSFALYRSIPEMQKMEDYDVDNIGQYDQLLHIAQMSIQEDNDVLTLRLLDLVRRKVHTTLEEISDACGEPHENFEKHVNLLVFLDAMEEGFVTAIDSFAATKE